VIIIPFTVPLYSDSSSLLRLLISATPLSHTECEATFSHKRPQDVKRHVLALHLPYAFFCTISPCLWRGGREDEYSKHLENNHRGYEKREPGQTYDKALVLRYIFENHAPLETVELYALEFIAVRAIELKKVEEWKDLCGRQAKGGPCRCHMLDN
jgi:hypothetical protein